MGKSSSGKDTIYKRILEDKELNLKNLVTYTTRPIREGEQNGVEYFFVGEEELCKLEAEGKVIELREYNTVHGIWKYFTANDEQIDLANNNYLVIGTLESYNKMLNYYTDSVIMPIYIEVDDGIRLERALKREQLEAVPKYEEMCRRFLADQKDFSEENLEKAKITKRFRNIDLEECILEIKQYISGKK